MRNPEYDDWFDEDEDEEEAERTAWSPLAGFVMVERERVKEVAE